MKRSPLNRKTPLKQGKALAQRSEMRPSGKPLARAKRRPLEPGEAEWKRERYGKCKRCGEYGPLVLHHVLLEQIVRRCATPEQIRAGICWDQRNALAIGAPMAWNGVCICHAAHHNPGTRDDARIPLAKVPTAALEFASELLGPEAAGLYFERRYTT